MIYFELNGEKAVITWQYETITREIAGHGVEADYNGHHILVEDILELLHILI